MKYIAITGLWLLICTGTFAQNKHFTSSGIIEFEKTVNMYAIMQKDINKDNEMFLQPALEDYKKNKPQFKKMPSTLIFNKTQTYFKPGEDNESNGFFNNAMIPQNSTIYTDLATGISTAQKKVYEESFLLKDTVRSIKWKITDEVRDIAGYTCRRANAVIMDSIYVVAFYTNEIPVSGGPESFTGLPGMILGVALPHENVTWFATKVTDRPVQDTELKVPTKGKPVNNKQLRTIILAALKDWGEYGKSALKALFL